MSPQFIDLNSIVDRRILAAEKERLKDQVVCDIDWRCRIDLYRRIAEINERISQLQDSP